MEILDYDRYLIILNFMIEEVLQILFMVEVLKGKISVHSHILVI
jgi:hypothetical protein